MKNRKAAKNWPGPKAERYGDCLKLWKTDQLRCKDRIKENNENYYELNFISIRDLDCFKGQISVL